jgi:cysteine desulfurase/selenocysteine lyase
MNEMTGHIECDRWIIVGTLMRKDNSIFQGPRRRAPRIKYLNRTSMMNKSWDEWRSLFPVTRNWIYFNHAATGPYSTLTVRAMESYVRDFEANGAVNYERWQGLTEEVRVAAGALLNCTADEVALVSNTSEGANIVAQGLEFREGDNVIVPAEEFPANIYPWLNLGRRGIDTRIVPLVEGRVRIQDILSRADDRTRLVAVSSVAYHNGFRLDMETLGARLEALGIPFYVDGIQSLGVIPMDVKRCRISFLAADGHKWLLGPEGAGLFYCALDLLPSVKQAYASWLSVREPHRFDRIALDFAPSARRFECGTLNTAGLVGLHRSLETLLEVGIDRIMERILLLTGLAGEGLRRKGYRLLSPWEEDERSGILTFDHPAHDTEKLSYLLREAGVIQTLRGGGVRISPHFYNNEEEVEAFLAALP